MAFTVLRGIIRLRPLCRLAAATAAGALAFGTPLAAMQAPEPARAVGAAGRPSNVALGAAVRTNDAGESMLLVGKPDTYKGMIIDTDSVPRSADDFVSVLRASLDAWRAGGVRGVWLHLPLDLSHLVPLAVAHGFKYHHANERILTLTNWLPESPSTLPHGPTHQVGVGGFVLNDKCEVLMVKERTGPAAKLGIWKLPTGIIERGEDLVDAARREVLEETGVRTHAEESSVVSFRHAHPRSADGVSDLFFVVSLRADSESSADAALRIQESEILEAKWMPLAEVVELEYYKQGGVLYEMVLGTMVEERPKFEPKRMTNGSRPGSSLVYRSRM